MNEQSCVLAYTVHFTGATAQVEAIANDAAPHSYTVKGRVVGESVLFFGVDLFVAPRSCTSAEVTIQAPSPARANVSSSLARGEEDQFSADAVVELQQSLWVVGRESELRMLDGAFSAVLIAEAQSQEEMLSVLVSQAAAALGAPGGRLLILGPKLSGKDKADPRIIDSSAAHLDTMLANAVAGLWLAPGAARDYYSLLLGVRTGLISPEQLVAGLRGGVGRYFCFDVLARSNHASLDDAIRNLLSQQRVVDEKSVSAALQISACLGDGLTLAAPTAGLKAGKEVQVTDPARLRTALGL